MDENMTYNELLATIDDEGEFLVQYFDSKPIVHSALRAVMELHKPFKVNDILLCECEPIIYPCPTIKAIEKELK